MRLLDGPQSPEERRLHKNIMFALHYGMGKERLADMLAEADRARRQRIFTRRVQIGGTIALVLGAAFLLWTWWYHGVQ